MKRYIVPLLAACLLLTAGCAKAPDTAESSADPTAAVTATPETTEAPAPTPEPGGTDGRAALCCRGGDSVCPLRGEERRGKGAQHLASFLGKGRGGRLYPRGTGYADVHAPGGGACVGGDPRGDR